MVTLQIKGIQGLRFHALGMDDEKEEGRICYFALHIFHFSSKHMPKTTMQFE